MRAAIVVAAALGLVACVPGGGDDAGVDDGGENGDDAGADGDDDAGFVGDGGTTAAIAGARCAPADRVGLVEIEDSFGFVTAYATLFDRPEPWLGAPTLVDDACAFYEGAACACALDEACDADGACVAAPVPAADVVLVLRAGGDEQVLDTAQGAGSVGGEVTIDAAAYAVELRGLGVTVTLDETAIPRALDDPSGSLDGSYDAPAAVDIAWTAPTAAGTSVFTHVPMNHHVNEPTFTECAVAASTGALHIDGDMLQPLSVSTGLEFQGIEHVRFAAADTPVGCVEIRLATSQYVDLGF